MNGLSAIYQIVLNLEIVTNVSQTPNVGFHKVPYRGLLLFLVYINDLLSVSTLFMPILFTNLFCTGWDLDDLVQKIDTEMGKIYSWGKAHESFNVDLTNFKLFAPKYFSRSKGNIYINGTCIIEVTKTIPWSYHRSQVELAISYN